MTDEIVNQFVDEGVPELLHLESEDILLIWALTANNCWYLCAQCDTCEQWMQFPWVEHQCLNENYRWGLGEEVAVVAVIPTSIAEVTQNLFCEETILSD